MSDIKVNTTAVDELAKNTAEAKRAVIGRLAERGYQLLREEIRETAYVTGNLWQGVAPPDVDYQQLRALLTVSARSGRRGARKAEIYFRGEKRGEVTLRAQPAFNYAEVVARGRRAQLQPKKAKAFLIPVNFTPTDGEYLKDSSGQIYIVRRSIKAAKPNPFDQRAAARLRAEADSIASAAVQEFVQ